MQDDTIPRKKAKFTTERQVRKDVKKKKTFAQQTPREKGYTREFLSYLDDWNYSQRIAEFTKKYKFHKAYVYQIASSLSWRELLGERMANMREEEDKVKIEEEIKTFQVNKSFTDLSELIKQNTSYSLIISNGLLKHSLFMMDYYSEQTEQVVQQAGGAKKLKAEDRALIEYYDKKINSYKRELQFMLAPGQVTNYLKALGVYDELGGKKNEEDEFSITPARILELLQEIDVSSRPTLSVEEMVKAVGREDDLKIEVNGRVLADVDMSERKKERFKRVEDEKLKKSS